MSASIPPTATARIRSLGQYPTPAWAALAIVERYFGDLDSRDLVIEPACGPGAFLNAIPEYVAALGVEIDASTAELARINTGRQIITGDFRKASFDVRPTLVLGNPPFNLQIVDGFLHRAHQLLPDGGRVGFLLPAYAFQTASRVADYADRWSIRQEMIPRNIYPGLSLPLVFSLFSKDRHRTLIGFALYQEAADVLSLKKPYREALGAGAGPVWRIVVETALNRLGGEADLPRLYTEIAGNRPTRTDFWREQVRRTLRRYHDHFVALGAGRYRLSNPYALPQAA